MGWQLKIRRFALAPLFALCVLCAQQAWADAGASAVAIAQAEQKLEQLDHGAANKQQLLKRLEHELARMKAELGTFATTNSHSSVQEQWRLKRRMAGLQQHQREQLRELTSLRQKTRAERVALLALYQRACLEAGHPSSWDERVVTLQQQLGTKLASGQSVRAQAEFNLEAESGLRHKARVVAARIRQLRGQQKLVGDVIRTTRNQALFDEDERRLTVSRVRTRMVTDSEARSDSSPQSPVSGSGGNAADPDVPGENDDFSNGVPNSELGGEFADGDGTGAYDRGGKTFETTLRTLSVEHEVLAGNRINALLSEDVVGLIDARQEELDANEELRRLESLRIELLRSADELAKQRSVLEAEARKQRR